MSYFVEVGGAKIKWMQEIEKTYKKGMGSLNYSHVGRYLYADLNGKHIGMYSEVMNSGTIEHF